MTAEGKIIIKLAEFEEGFFIRKKVLVVLKKDGTLQVCKVKKSLTAKELKLLSLDLDAGLVKIDNKIQKGGPITVIKGLQDGAVYYDDLMIMKTEKGVITCNII